jgi:2'-5' RNA ligase
MTAPGFTDEQRTRARELERWHYDWTAEQVAAGVDGPVPPGSPVPSDANQHVPDLAASGAALDRFFSRANDIMGLTPGSALTAAADVQTGAMVAFIPSEADCQRLAVAGGEPPEQIHMTAAYLGDAADWPDMNREQLAAACQQLADSLPPFPAQGFGVSIFNPTGDEPAIVMGISGAEPADAQAMAATALAPFAHLMPPQHRPQVAHVTLAYQSHRDFARQLPGYVQRCGPVNFDRLRVAFAGDVIDFDLGGSTMIAADAPGGGAMQPNVIIQPVPLDVIPEAAEGTPFFGVCAVEGIWTGDRRMFALGSLDLSAPLPWALKWQRAEDEGHEGSVIVGRIDTAVRTPDNMIHITGVMDDGPDGGADGCEAARLMENGMLRGNSVMTDSTDDVDIEMIYPQPVVQLEVPMTPPADTPPGVELEPMWEPDTDIFPGEPAMIIHKARIRSVTLLAEPAFVEAVIQLGTEAAPIVEDGMAQSTGPAAPIVAAGHTITIPDVPPAWWFDEPTDVQIAGALTVTDEGRVYGMLAPAAVAHRSFRDRRITVPMGNVDYGRFLGREVIVAGGGRRVSGVVTMNCGHCPPGATSDPALRMQHYDNTCSIVADINIIEKTGLGVIVAGALKPWVTAEQVSTMMSSVLSGDWAPHPERSGWREFVAALLVPVPGYPMPRTAPSVASGQPESGSAQGLASVRFDRYGLVASTVPVAFGPSVPLVADGRAALERIARSIGRDAGSRFAELRRRVDGGG